MVAAADPAGLDPAIGHVGAAVRAMAVDQSEPAARILVEHEILAHQADRLDRNLVELTGAADRHPVAAQQVAHRRARPDAREQLVLGGRQQSFTSALLRIEAHPMAIFFPLRPAHVETLDTPRFGAMFSGERTTASVCAEQ
jgi:hypothetical protein